jgi:hypothetical protein
MKISFTFSAIVLLLLFSFVSCEKCDCDVEGEVEFYLLSAYDTMEGSPEIDLATLVLAENPILSYADLKSYNAKAYYFKLTDLARERIEGMDHSVAGTAFAVTASKEVVYTGYFLPSYSSLGMQWIVIDPLFWHLSNRMYVKLGYPGSIEGEEIPDLRNDDRILGIFRRDGNLVE